MFGHVEQTVDRYCELAGVSEDELKPVAIPCTDDHTIPPQEFETKGQMKSLHLFKKPFQEVASVKKNVFSHKFSRCVFFAI